MWSTVEFDIEWIKGIWMDPKYYVLLVLLKRTNLVLNQVFGNRVNILQ